MYIEFSTKYNNEAYNTINYQCEQSSSIRTKNCIRNAPDTVIGQSLP